MSNDFYNPSGSPGTRSAGSSSVQRAEFTSVAAGFSKLAPLAALFFVRTNSAGTAQESISPSATRTAIGAVGTADANVFTANQTIQKSLPVFLLKDTDTTLTDGQEVATLNVEQSDASAPGLSAKIAAIADGVAGKLKWVFSVGLPSALANVLTINDGGVVVDGTLDVSGNLSMSGAINEARATVVSHATTADIWGAAGNQIDFTGSATVTDVPDAPQAGAVRWLTCDAGITFTNNANIAVQGDDDYLTEAGDLVRFEALTTSTFAATIVKKNGEAVVVPTSAPEVRQTVSAGPVDSSGYSDFGGSTGSTTVTASGTLTLTSANGTTDHTWTATNPSWTGLSTNGTMYLYHDETDGAIASTLAPTYRWGGADVTTNGQFTYNIQEAVAKVGNGTTADQKYRVCVGQVTVAGGVVTAITWYQLKRRYYRDSILAAASTAYSYNHNIGCPLLRVIAWIECTTTDAGYAVGDRIYTTWGDSNGTGAFGGPIWTTALTVGLTTGAAAGWLNVPNKSTGVQNALAYASWRLGFEIFGGF
mgnify:CR=1 FL=1